MNYQLIRPKDVFRYKALPQELWGRITALPKCVTAKLPPLSGFPEVDAQAERTARMAINWDEVPERNPTGNDFMDAFAALVHQYGYKRMKFYARKLQENSEHKFFTDEDLCSTIRVLTGMSSTEWVVEYTLLMVQDLRKRTNLMGREIVSELYFTTPQSYSQFLKNYA